MRYLAYALLFALVCILSAAMVLGTGSAWAAGGANPRNRHEDSDTEGGPEIARVFPRAATTSRR